MNNSLTATIPKEVYLGFSGGIDSVFALDFLIKGKRDVTLLHFNHGTTFGGLAEEWVYQKYIKEYYKDCTGLHFGYGDCSDRSSEEEFRNARHEFFSSKTDKPVILAHSLSDEVEWRIFSYIRNGVESSIPHINENIIRPFLNFPREEIRDYVVRNNLEWIEDPSNSSVEYSRNRIRHNIIQQMLVINPGLYKRYKR